MFQNSKGNETNIKLPFSFIAFSMLALILSQVLLLLNGDLLVTGTFRLPAIWSAAHLFVLGWALMVAMGAMYQLVPVAFLTPIWNEKFGFVQFFITASGIVLFAAALYVRPQDALIPGIVTLTGILLFLVQMFMTLKSQAKPNILTLFVGSALLSLLATITLGIMLVLSMNTGFASDYYQVIFKSHILLGTAGWFSLLIFGFSYKMVPMFSLAHGYTMKPAVYVFLVYFSGMISLISSFLLESRNLEMLGTFLLFAGFVIFTWHVKKIIDKRVKKKLDRPFMFALFAIGCGAVIHLAAVASSAYSMLPKMAGPIIFLYLIAWIAFSIIGYLYKIVPFLWWTHKYSKEIGKQKVPSLKEMMDEKMALPLFLLFIVGAVLLTASFAAKLLFLFYIGQGLILIAAILFSFTIAKVVIK
ncbi:hypothetical protein M3204_19475 [Mesobacillus subterraneus]|uniref:hypothetical protein n=1 Tax=Mesobacillus subterraneus TaxID=285983 RepID=UPI00203B1D90|nr:hypothetical protein [Mesobacillus subterraneus]MCM3666606.1 hypothetical protein [Mesobacillus subterraneus]MCM3682476.1 hypothetical protein [Mesobacillus subterraneus]